MQPGDQLAGRYELVERIGAGGMGEVWRGEQITLGRAVAIKLILREHLSDAEEQGSVEGAAQVRRRFEREAEIAARVQHRNLIDIIDFGQSEAGDPYIVMPFLEGETLHDRLRREPAPSLVEMLRWTRGILGGLGALHAADIVHRDLKPANVFLAEDADGIVPKLLDFGISRRGGGASTSATGLTQAGVAVGTPQFMAPEQFESARDVDARADLFSVGVILYRALTGKPPYDADDAFAIYRKILTTEPHRLQACRPDLAPELDALVHRALARSRDERFASAAEMRAELDALASSGLLPGVTLGALAVSNPGLELGNAPTALSPAVAPSPGVAKTAAMLTPASSGAASSGSSGLASTRAMPSGVESTAPVDSEPVIELSARRAEPAPVPSKSRAPLVIVTIVASLAMGAGAFYLAQKPAEPSDETATPSAGTPSPQPAPEQEPTGPAAIRVSAAHPLAQLALAWGSLPPGRRPDDVRFVPTEGHWAAVVPPGSALDPASAAAALGAEPSPIPFAEEAALTPLLSKVRARLNVHTQPDLHSPTIRVLPHETLVVALFGTVEEAPSQPEGDGALTYFIVSPHEAGWASSRLVGRSRTCRAPADALVRDAGTSAAAIEADLLVSRTHVEVDGDTREAWLLTARDPQANRSYVGIYAARTGCWVGESLAFHVFEGTLDELFFTETGGENGRSLLMASWFASRRAPDDGVLEWGAYVLDEPAPIWSDRIPTAPALGRNGGGVSGTRDRLLRRHTGYVLAVRKPDADRVWYRFDGGAFAVNPGPD